MMPPWEKLSLVFEITLPLYDYFNLLYCWNININYIVNV